MGVASEQVSVSETAHATTAHGDGAVLALACLLARPLAPQCTLVDNNDAAAVLVSGLSGYGEGGGGAIFQKDGVSLEVDTSTLRGNTALGGGGGAVALEGMGGAGAIEATLKVVWLGGNWAEDSGAASGVAAAEALSVTGCVTFVGAMLSFGPAVSVDNGIVTSYADDAMAHFSDSACLSASFQVLQ